MKYDHLIHENKETFTLGGTDYRLVTEAVYRSDMDRYVVSTRLDQQWFALGPLSYWTKVASTSAGARSPSNLDSKAAATRKEMVGRAAKIERVAE